MEDKALEAHSIEMNQTLPIDKHCPLDHTVWPQQKTA